METRVRLSHRQAMAWDYLFDDKVEEVLYGGAKGGGKSVFGCFATLEYVRRMTELLALTTKPKYPYVIGFLGRKRSVDFTKTTLETWKKFIPSNFYTYNDQKKEIVMVNNMFKFHCGGMDDENNIAKFNSAEYGFIFVDQAEELSRDDAGMLRATLGRAKIKDIALPPKILWTANPSICFLKEDFLSNDILPTRKYVRALPSDNEFIDSKKYVEKLRESFKHRPELIQAYVEGNWEKIQGEGFLLSREDCIRAKQTKLPLLTGSTKTIVSCDPAWLGESNDEAVIYVIRSNRVIDSAYFYNVDTIRLGSECVKNSNQYSATAIGVDAIGIGAGVFDNVKYLRPYAVPMAIKSSETGSTEEDKDKFMNLRAEMWWKATEVIKTGKFELPDDEELMNQLCSVKYEIRNGRIKIEDKKEIKARLGRSPDRADALVMGIWMTLNPLVKYDNTKESDDYVYSDHRTTRRAY